MNKPIFSFLAALAALASVSCGANSSSPSDAGATTTVNDGSGGGDGTVSGNTPLPCDVNSVVVRRCQTCHSNPTQSSAPMPLVTWEDFQTLTPADSLGPPVVAQPVWKTAQSRIHDPKFPMPQPPNTTLDAADMATMDAWFAAGAPKTDSAVCGDASVGVPDAAPPTVTCNTNNVNLTPASAWTMPTADNDDYVCYSVNIPTDAGTNHVMAITPNVVNHKIVHHVLLFQANANDTSITTTPQKCSAGGSLTWRIVYGWAPGGGPMQTPPNVGFPYDSTTKWVVQIHYNNINHLAGETDTSGFSFCSTEQPVQYDSDVIAFGTQSINVPALSTLDQTCSVTVSSLFSGIHLFAAFPHMHQIGTAIESEQSMPGGGIVDLGRNIPWNFNNQIWGPVEATLNTGDVVSTRCAWQNSTGNAVTFGQNTENEMCYSFTAYYPRITSAAWSWALPALESTCATSPAGGLPTPDGGWYIPEGGAPVTDAGPTDSGGGD